MHIVSTNFVKTLVWKYEYDVKLWRHKHIKHKWPPYGTEWNHPHENFLHTPLHWRQPEKDKQMSTLPSLEEILQTPMCIIYIAEDIEFQSTKQQRILHFSNKNESQLPERVYPQGGHEASSSTSNVQFVKSVCADLLIVAGLTEELKTKRRICQVVRWKIPGTWLYCL